MGSKERMAREKDEVRDKILKASMEIIIEEGCLALSMRKIAERVEYAASTIYEYFANKDAILIELTNNGYLALSKELKSIENDLTDSMDLLISMWKTYWQFAFKNQELYKLMFGIQISCPKPEGEIVNLKDVEKIVSSVIRQMNQSWDHQEVQRCYLTMWSLVHGLISINLVIDPIHQDVNCDIISTSMKKIIS